MLNTLPTHATGDVFPASDWNTYMRDNLNAYGVGRITVSAWSGGPPVSPSDTDIWIATAVDANGARWAFQYNAGSASAYKWELIGGAPITSRNVTIGSWAFGSSINYANLTLGRAGDYEVNATAQVTTTSGPSSTEYAQMTVNFTTGSGTIVVDARYLFSVVSGSNTNGTQRGRVTGVSAGAVLTASLFKNGSGGSWVVNDGLLSILPFRIA